MTLLAAGLSAQAGLQHFNMEYLKALEQAALLAERTRQSAFIVGHGDDYAVLSHEPKLLGGRSIKEVRPTVREDDPDAA